MANGIYHYLLRLAHLRHTLTYYLQHEAKAEPLVAVLLATACGVVWGSGTSGIGVLRDSSFLGLGLLLGHLFWSSPAKV